MGKTITPNGLPTSSDLAQFRARLLILVEIAGNQSELARRSKETVTQKEISRLLKGERDPMLETAIGLATAGRVSLDWLAGRDRRSPLHVPIDNLILKQAKERMDEEYQADLELEDMPLGTRAETLVDLYEVHRRDARRPSREKVLEIIRRKQNLGCETDEQA